MWPKEFSFALNCIISMKFFLSLLLILETCEVTSVYGEICTYHYPLNFVFMQQDNLCVFGVGRVSAFVLSKAVGGVSYRNVSNSECAESYKGSTVFRLSGTNAQKAAQRIISATGSREIPFMSYAGYWVKTADNQCGIIKNEIIYGPYEVKNCGQNCELCLETHILLCQYFT